MEVKGFTLIELLAVILILGIIAIIAIPTVNKIVEQSKKGAFEASVNDVVSVIEDACQLQTLKDEAITTTYTFTNGEVSPALDIKGKLPTSGTATVDSNCNVSLDVTNGMFTATKTSLSDSVAVAKSGEASPDTPLTVTYSVSTGTDDGWTEYAGYEDFNQSYAYLRVGYAYSYRNIWVKWNNIDIPKGSTITSAYVQYKAKDNLNSQCKTLLYFNDVANAVAPISYADSESKVLTTANIEWDLPATTLDEWYNSPDISGIIQEIIDRADWNSGNAMMLMHRRHPDNNIDIQDRIFSSYEDGVANSPKLVITYIAP
jgi:prepilin-type N-terminal cleavage/methylation domain-containing protein